MKTKINKKPLYPILILLLTMFFPLSVYSHSGRTDSDGGHYDKNNDSGLGSYHYHHGYPAHLHTDGICIYSFEDNTDHSSGSSTSNSNHNNTEIYSTEPIINEISVPEKNKDYFIYENLYIIVFGTVFLFLLIAISAGYISKWLSKSYFNDFFIWNTWYERKNIDSKLSNIQSMINNYQRNLINSEKYSADILALKQKNNDILKKIPQSIPLDKKRCVVDSDIPGLRTVYISSKRSAMHRYKGCCGATQPIKTTDAIKERHKICLKCFFSPCGEELQKIHKNDKDIQKLERVKNTYYPQLLIDSLRNIYKQALLEIRNDTMKDVRNIDYLINKTNFYDMLTKNLNADEYEDIPSKEDFIRLCEYVKKLNNNYSYVTNEYNKKLHKYKKIIIFGVIIEIISVAMLIFFILNL